MGGARLALGLFGLRAGGGQFHFRQPALGDVLVGGNPTAGRHRPAGDRNDAPVGQLDDLLDRLPRRHRRLKLGDIAFWIGLREAPGFHAMRDEAAQGAAGLHHVRRQPVDLEIALVADDQPGLGVEHQQALGHVVDRRIEADRVPEEVAAEEVRSQGSESTQHHAPSGCPQTYVG